MCVAIVTIKTGEGVIDILKSIASTNIDVENGDGDIVIGINESAVETVTATNNISLVTKLEGLDVSHNGIIIVDEKGDPYLLDASMSGGKVMLESKPLFKYLEHSKNNIGVRVFRMIP